MPSLSQPLQKDRLPKFLTIGHVAKDVQPTGSYALGGTVTFAALTAYRLGLEAAIVTRAESELLADLPALLPGIGVAGQASPETTTFANSYHEGFRTQYLQARAESMAVSDVPDLWQQAPIILLGPLAQEITPAFVQFFSQQQRALLAATPQGWLRGWDENGSVYPTIWNFADDILPLLNALILSYEDLLAYADSKRADIDALLARWSMQVPLLVATAGRNGALLFQHGLTRHFPAYPATEVDPTGAGDVFAAAFLTQLYRTGDPYTATDFANCAASLSIEHEGANGIPTLERVLERMRLPR